VEIDPAEHLEPRRFLAREVREAGRRVVMILQDDRAHALRARLLRRVDAVDRPRHVVGIGVNVDVDCAAQHARAVIRDILLRKKRGAQHDGERRGGSQHGYRAPVSPRSPPRTQSTSVSADSARSAAAFRMRYATICGIRFPYTSVSRMSRPLNRYVSFL